MDGEGISNVTDLAEFQRLRRLTQDMVGTIIDPWTRPCPFMGCAMQHLTPCEVEAKQVDRSYRTENWFAVLCECGATSRAGRTERDAYDNLNRRS